MQNKKPFEIISDARRVTSLQSWLAKKSCHGQTLIKATFYLTICVRGKRATGKIQRNNYRHGSCGPSSTGKTMSVFFDLHARDASECQKSFSEKQP